MFLVKFFWFGEKKVWVGEKVLLFGVKVLVFQIKKVPNDFKYTEMKILYLKCYKLLLSQKQQVRNDLFGYRGYWLSILVCF